MLIPGAYRCPLAFGSASTRRYIGSSTGPASVLPVLLLLDFIVLPLHRFEESAWPRRRALDGPRTRTFWTEVL